MYRSRTGNRTSLLYHRRVRRRTGGRTGELLASLAMRATAALLTDRLHAAGAVPARRRSVRRRLGGRHDRPRYPRRAPRPRPPARRRPAGRLVLDRSVPRRVDGAHLLGARRRDPRALRARLSRSHTRLRGADRSRGRVPHLAAERHARASVRPRAQRLAPRAARDRGPALRRAGGGRRGAASEAGGRRADPSSPSVHVATRRRVRRHRRHRQPSVGLGRGDGRAHALVADLPARGRRAMAPDRRRTGAAVSVDPPTAPAGDIPDRYDSAAVEKRWYPLWEERGYFRADSAAKGKPYSISMPPPNVTGSLHWGHALTMTLQDTLARMKRMDGFNTLWLPGTDHASIAVHVILERMLAAEGQTKEDLGRDSYLARAWQWREESGGTIVRQLRRLGASCDWSRERFTMAAGLSRAVGASCVRLWEEGLIYRAD